MEPTSSSFRPRVTGVPAAATLIVAVTACASPADRSDDAALLRSLHEQVLVAHRTADLDLWMAAEADDYVSVNGGLVTWPTAAERRAARAPYLASTTFSVYRDLRPPLVRIADDGSLGWVIAEVEMVGVRSLDGRETPVQETWAWIELYAKEDGAWRMVGNVSNRRP